MSAGRCGVREEVVAALACPHCQGALSRRGAALACRRGHSFDVARQGYVSLLSGARRVRGDTAAMVAARESFLAGGHFAGLADRLAEAAVEASRGQPASGRVVELGAGTGYYLAAVLDRLPDRVGIGLDVSVAAARRAARAHPRLGSVVCDVWQRLPLADAVAAVTLCVFAPRNPPESRRVLRPGGVLLVVTPAEDHLRQLRDPLGLLGVEADKRERLDASLAAHFEPAGRGDYQHTMRLGRAAALAAAGMGPAAFHTDPDALARRAALLPDPVEVSCSVTVSCYRAR